MTAYSRLALLLLFIVILGGMASLGKTNKAARPYVAAFAVPVLANIVFYAMSTLFRFGVWEPPVNFSELSNYRNWVTAIAALIVIIGENTHWTGRK